MIDSERMNMLIQSFLEDNDHGREKMKAASLLENLCLTSYIESQCIPIAKENGKDNDLKFFEEYAGYYKMMTLDRIMKLDNYGIVVSQATNHFYTINKDVIVLVDMSEADFLVNSLAKDNIDVEIREISRQEFKAMLADLYRTGFNNVQFTDGKLRPMIVAKETIYRAEKEKSRTNPELYIESLVFLQEAHKFGKENKGVLIKKDSPIAKAVRTATYLVPAIVQSKNGNEMQVKYPFLNTTVEGQRILPVATDHKEFEYFITSQLMKDYNNLPKEKKACIELPFSEVYRVFTTDDLFAIAVNPIGYNFILNGKLLEVIAEGIGEEEEEQTVELLEDESEGLEPINEAEAAKNKYENEGTNDLRRKVLEHFIETQQGIIEKNKDLDTPEAKKKVKKAQTKLKDFQKQLEALD